MQASPIQSNNAYQHAQLELVRAGGFTFNYADGVPDDDCDEFYRCNNCGARVEQIPMPDTEQDNTIINLHSPIWAHSRTNGPGNRSVISAQIRFFNKVKKSANCWLWIGATASSGQGNFWNGEAYISAHRYSYTLHFGEIPQNHIVTQTCSNRKCVKPEHLQILPKKHQKVAERFWAK